MQITTLYYLFTLLVDLGMGMTATTYAPFLESIGLKLGDISLINAVFWMVIIAAELPTGMLADGRSRAWSLKTGLLIKALGAGVYIFAQGVMSAILGEVLLGIGMAFLSGAKQAWIADALARERRSEELRRVYATDAIISGTSVLLGGFVGSAIALISYRLIWVPLIFTTSIAWMLCQRFMNSQGEPMERVSELTALRLSWNHLRASPSLKWVIATMVLFGTVLSFNHFWSLYFKPQVGQLGLSWIWVVIYLGYLPAGFFVRHVGIQMGKEWRYLVGSMLMAGWGLVLLSLGTTLVPSLFFLVLHEFGRGLFYPLLDTFVQHRVESSFRATFGSLQSFIGRIGFVIVPLITWILIDGAPPTQGTIGAVWLVSGMILVMGTCLFWILRPSSVHSSVQS